MFSLCPSTQNSGQEAIFHWNICCGSILSLVQFFFLFFFVFLGVVMYDNEFETKEIKIWTKYKIEPQYIHAFSRSLVMKIWTNIKKGKWLSKRKVNKICKTKSCSLEKRHGIFTFLKQVEASARKARGREMTKQKTPKSWHHLVHTTLPTWLPLHTLFRLNLN